MDERGVLSADLLFATLMVIIIIASMVSLVDSELSKTQTGEFGKARMVGERVAEAVNTVYINGPGYEVNLTLPNGTYTINVTNGTIKIYHGSYVVSLNIVPKTDIIPANLSAGSSYNLKNDNGTIKITRIT
ncbi:MAG: hypothetical protein QFX38_06055 [Methanothermobacter sp.]|nr:hypothetical protein [Methanothermobacter sp.]